MKKRKDLLDFLGDLVLTVIFVMFFVLIFVNAI